jgi:PAS domain S-box-containing protein
MTRPHALFQENPAIAAADDAELRFRITDYSYAPVSETGAVAYLRAWRQASRPDIRTHPLTIARAKSDPLVAKAARQLRNELALCAALDTTWALKPSGSVVGAGAVVLLYDDADILSLEKVAPHALTTACFIRLAPRLVHLLESMHAAGVIHRNINPGCFFIGIDSAADEASYFRVKIGGFGLATVSLAGDTADAISLLLGDLPYMSPEHSGRTQRGIDARSDLYSLGVVFYRLLTGHLPFGVSGVENDAAQWIHFHIATEAVAPHLLSKAIPEMLSKIVMRLLEKNPDRRYQSAAQLRADLEQCQRVLTTPATSGTQNDAGSDIGPAALLTPATLDDIPEAAAQLARLDSPSTTPTQTRPPSETANIRDLESVIRAARALSEEIRLDELMQSVMSVTLEHVGADRGLLIRLDAQVAYIDACARTTTSGITVDLRHTPATENDLPMAILLQALNTGLPVYASDEGTLPTSPGTSGAGDAARAVRCKAICVPMLKQARVVGALYLENRILPDAFTVEHTQILQLLASQAAISLETARLYAALLEENAQRKAAENALRASQTSLVQGEQFNHIGSVRYLLKEGLMYCSAELCRIYGLEAGKEVISYEEFSALLHPDDRKSVLDTIEAAIAVGGTIRVEHRICRKSGEVRYISGIGKPFYVDGKFSEYFGTATDITSRRQAEDALRIAQADLARVSRATTVGQLTASIAHEINQPLMSIVSNAGASLRWMDRSPMQLENARAGLRDIVSEGQRAGDMIQSLQRLTRNTEAVFERINLNAAIRHILAISRSEIERREVALSLDLAQENLHVTGDSVQLQQVLLNLVINAVEAMSEITTRPRVLSISSFGLNDKTIAVIVEDTGEGIAADAIERVFDAFYTTKKNGMGMGLAICRSIIETHRGRLQASVRQPHGSRFSFELPLAQ